MAISIFPILPDFAAEIGDVDLAKPLSPEDREAIKAAFWKYGVLVFPALHALPVWLGLRPQEIDNLHNLSLWKLEKNSTSTGKDILWVFQSKIVALPPEDRWKPIPIIFDEQKFALRMLEAKCFKRPLSKTMRLHFGKGTTLYAGRKGFVDLMLAKGHSIENISVWMGHSTLERTWRSYKQRRKFHLGY